MTTNYIFDLFGTLVNNEGYDEMMESLFPEIESSVLQLFINNTNFSSEEECLEKISFKFNLNFDSNRKNNILKATNNWVEERTLYPYVNNVLSTLKNHGSKMGLVSNNNIFVEKVLDRLGLRPFFDSVVFSHKVRAMKPDERIYLLCLEELSVAANSIVMIGDQLEKDVLKPIELGMKGILFDPKNRSSYQPKISSLKELLKCTEFSTRSLLSSNSQTK